MAPGAAEGLVVVDKPPGCTSHDVVAACRRIYRTRRVGHAGTLDPDATGVLCVGVGSVTRLLRFVGDGWKTYTAEVVLGTSTDTMDDSGKPTGSWDMSHIGEDAVTEAARRLTGPIMQTPPMVSAVRVGGRRLHQLAREGVVVDRAPRPVVVRSLALRPTTTSSVWLMDVTCSTGTYVRVLAHDLGAMLGGGAHIRRLRRTAVGRFTVESAVSLEHLSASAEQAQGALATPLDAVADLARVEVPPEAVGAVRNGTVFSAPDFSKFRIVSPGPPHEESGDGLHGFPSGRPGVDSGRARQAPAGDTWAVVSPDGDLLAVYGRYERGIKPLVVMGAGGGSD